MQYFDPDPTFSFAGTCYTTRAQIIERQATITSNFKLMLFVDANATLEMTYAYHLFDSLGRVGVGYSLSYWPDHPSTSPYWNPMAAKPNTILSTGLRMTQV